MVQRLAQTFTERIRHPKEGVSPGYNKSRKERRPDRFVQSRIKIFSQQEKSVPSTGFGILPALNEK